MLRFIVKVPIIAAVLMAATLVFAEEIVVSALILATVMLGVVSLLVGAESEEPPIGTDVVGGPEPNVVPERPRAVPHLGQMGRG